MLVRLFGATSSPSFCSFALRQVGIDNWANAEPNILTCLEKNIYVDNFLNSLCNKDNAICIIAQLTDFLKQRRFHLTKLSFSYPQILSVLPNSNFSSTMLDLNLAQLKQKCWD